METDHFATPLRTARCPYLQARRRSGYRVHFFPHMGQKLTGFLTPREAGPISKRLISVSLHL
jgi:hypothetical protein